MKATSLCWLQMCLSVLSIHLYAAGPPSSRMLGLATAFEPNLGQTDPTVDFIARGAGYVVFLSQGSATFRSGPACWKITLEGAQQTVRGEGSDVQQGASNYLNGDSAQSLTGVPRFSRVSYANVYPGIHIVYHGEQNGLKYDFVLEPGADPDRIALRFEGTEHAKIAPNGDLIFWTSTGELRQPRPIIYEEGDSKRRIPGGFVLRPNGLIGFELGDYDRTRKLIIDPVFLYSTFLGGGRNESATGIAVDSAGNAYITGWTESTDFPLKSPQQGTSRGGVDAFVIKLNPTGTGLVYATYLGGRGDDRAQGIAVDKTGSAILVGQTQSADFPVTAPLQGSLRGGRDAFVAKLNSAGSALAFSTYLGGAGYDAAYAVALDGSNNIYLTGETDSTAFPTLHAFQSQNLGTTDAFVTKLSPSGVLIFSTYLGGSWSDRGYGIGTDAAGKVYFTGSTESSNFPVKNASQNTLAGGEDAFVAGLSSDGQGLIYSTYLGGSGGTSIIPENGRSLAVDRDGFAFVTGTANSSNFPGVPLSNPPANTARVFITKFAPSGTRVYSALFGGSGTDRAGSVAVSSTGNAYIAGYTSSVDYPVMDPVQSTNAGLYDAFVTVLNTEGNALIFSSYLGGVSSDAATAIAVDGGGNAYVAGQTASQNFPVTSGVFQASAPGSFNAFSARLAFGAANAAPAVTSVSPDAGNGWSRSFTFTWTDSNGADDISFGHVLVNAGLNGVRSCLITYFQASNVLALLNDAGTIYEGVAPGSNASVQNGQCGFNGSTATVWRTGNQLSLTVTITFTPGFTGTKNIYMLAVDRQGAGSGWVSKGSWTVDAGVPSSSGSFYSSLFPGSGSAVSQVFHAQARGVSNTVTVLHLLFNTALDGRAACFVTYFAGTNQLGLLNDAGTAYTLVTPGAGVAVHNSQCVLNAARSSVSVSGTITAISVHLVATSRFSGLRTAFLHATDSAGRSSGWQPLGDWNPPAHSRPLADAVTPATGSGSTQTFTFSFLDPDGSGRISFASALISPALYGVNACFVTYFPAINAIGLLNDSGTSYTLVTPGTSATTSNSQCSISGANSQAWISAAGVTFSTSVTFSNTYTGSKNIYLYTSRADGVNSDWQAKGVWTVP